VTILTKCNFSKHG